MKLTGISTPLSTFSFSVFSKRTSCISFCNTALSLVCTVFVFVFVFKLFVLFIKSVFGGCETFFASVFSFSASQNFFSFFLRLYSFLPQCRIRITYRSINILNITSSVISSGLFMTFVHCGISMHRKTTSSGSILV